MSRLISIIAAATLSLGVGISRPASSNDVLSHPYFDTLIEKEGVCLDLGMQLGAIEGQLRASKGNLSKLKDPLAKLYRSGADGCYQSSLDIERAFEGNTATDPKKEILLTEAEELYHRALALIDDKKCVSKPAMISVDRQYLLATVYFGLAKTLDGLTRIQEHYDGFKARDEKKRNWETLSKDYLAKGKACVSDFNTLPVPTLSR